MSELNHFMFDPENSFDLDLFATEQEALEAAKRAIADFLEPDGWNDGADRIIVGTITYRSKEIAIDPERSRFEMTPIGTAHASPEANPTTPEATQK